MSITGAYTWEDISSLGMEAYFQPIYNVEKHRITGLEALFRARDGKGGCEFPYKSRVMAT